MRRSRIVTGFIHKKEYNGKRKSTQTNKVKNKGEIILTIDLEAILMISKEQFIIKGSFNN